MSNVLTCLSNPAGRFEEHGITSIGDPNGTGLRNDEWGHVCADGLKVLGNTQGRPGWGHSIEQPSGPDADGDPQSGLRRAFDEPGYQAPIAEEMQEDPLCAFEVEKSRCR
jgi:hypothetical protein